MHVTASGIYGFAIGFICMLLSIIARHDTGYLLGEGLIYFIVTGVEICSAATLGRAKGEV